MAATSSSEVRLKASFFSKNFDGAVAAAKMLTFVVMALVVLNLFFGIALIRTREQIVLVPPNLTEQVRIGYGSADAAYYKSWGLYVAEMVGNLTPGNAPFVAEALGRLFAASDYNAVRTAVFSQGQTMAQNGVVSFFKADAVVWEAQTSRIFVTGERREMSPTGTATSVETITYQMHVSMSAGQPVLDQFSVYSGSPHTLEWEKTNPVQPGPAASAASAS
jgi:conjugal transfer pilus assembly protein TraE